MQTNGKDIYINIKELPLVNEVQSGDFFIVETTQGTNIIDFSNIIIPPVNVSFYSEIEQLQTDVNAISTLYALQNAFITTISGILDNKINQNVATLNTKIDSVSTVYYEDARFVGGGGSFALAGNSNNVFPGRRCALTKNAVGNYTVTFEDTFIACVASSTADLTFVDSVNQSLGIATIETYDISYVFDLSGGSTAYSAITAIDTILTREPVDPELLTVIAF